MLIVIGVVVFAGGFIVGIEVNEHYARKRHEIANTGHLANINTALWSIMNKGLRMRKPRKKKKSLLTTQNLLKSPLEVESAVKKRSYDMLMRNGHGERGSEL